MVSSQLYATVSQHSVQLCNFVIDRDILTLYTPIVSVIIHAEEIDITGSNPSGVDVWAQISELCFRGK